LYVLQWNRKRDGSKSTSSSVTSSEHSSFVDVKHDLNTRRGMQTQLTIDDIHLCMFDVWQVDEQVEIGMTEIAKTGWCNVENLILEPIANVIYAVYQHSWDFNYMPDGVSTRDVKIVFFFRNRLSFP